MLHLTIEDRIPEDMLELIRCLAFWNRDGNSRKIYEANRNKTLGSYDSQEEAAATDFSRWELLRILYDLQTMLENKPDYICGLSGSHVWLSYKTDNRRIALIFNS